ncbi:hypothetical protein [Paenibacillus paeoniae]|uniref:DUF2178 domain-containing protein n=1 Tax=Paenibacillus paeoniae TaxID=2292705 RepID=A0A371PJG5_9BACL|nr:hypothetical protein [Paenibacillus paeoniae]REK76283.1 hypothetical protein DX130_04345 [Paenibacillus paeoniae]
MNQLVGLLGILVGASFGVIGVWWGLKKAAKNRGVDERLKVIVAKSHSTSWFITLGAIYCIFILYLLGVEFSVPAALGSLIFIQLGGWSISMYFYHKKY